MTLSFDPDRLELPHGHYIGGAWQPARDVLTLHRPSDGRGYAGTPIAEADIVDQAVETARAALAHSGWGRCQPRGRANAMHRWADLIADHAADLARLEAVSSTRPVGQMVAGDVAVLVEQIRFFAEMADKEGGDLVPTRADQLGMIASEPYGVVGAITPWNFPLSMAGWKLAPALAAGNAVVLKPSELTPFSTLRLAELAVAAGIPAGLINIVLGDGPTTGAALTAHPGIAKVSFTGSTAAGSAIMANIAQSGIKPVTLELGGKSPQLVLADADLDLAAECIAQGILHNAGQVCVAGSRVIVAAEVAEALADKLRARLAQIRPGPTWEACSTYSPIVSQRQIARIEGLVQQAQRAGAEALCGAERLGRRGYFYAPTILANVAPGNPALREEIFGPVLTLQSFADEDEGFALADHPDYGLAAGLFTRDLSRALRGMQRLQAGTVWINRYGRSRDHILPTGGFKGSGIGKDLGREAYHANRRTKSVLIDL